MILSIPFSFYRQQQWLLATFLLLLLTATGGQAQVLRATAAGGGKHSLSIHSDGSLWATGSNQYGQLGTGDHTSHATWVQIGSGTDWVQVAAGGSHSLALKADGSLWAWGLNSAGQLGIGTTTNTDSPTQVEDGSTYTQIAAGNVHSLALQADGSLYTWGSNQYGQLGTNNTANSTTPTPVAGIYTQLVGGFYHSLGLRADGSLWAWGYNADGELGTGSSSPSYVSAPVQAIGTYTQVAAGSFHNLGLRADGSLYAWGSNSNGQLGNGSTTSTPTPTAVAGTYTQVSAGNNHSLALRATGSLYAWGNNQYGELGTGNTTSSPTPTQVAGTYAQVVAGQLHSLGLKADGTLWAWGNNPEGELGNGSTSNSTTPVATGQAVLTRSMAVGANFGLVIRGDGTLWAWGNNQYGQLGNGTTAPHNGPVQVGTDRDWVQVAAGSAHSLALKANGSLYAWGSNQYGQLGNPTNSGTITATTTPLLVAGGTYTKVAAGSAHSLVLKADGTLWAWGNNQYGQLGSTTNVTTLSPNATPIQVAGTFTKMSAGQYHSLALKVTGTLYAWGSNQYGQLGNPTNSGTTTATTTPTQISGTNTYIQLAAGSIHSLGLRNDGGLDAWGSNHYGQTGSDLVDERYTLTQATGPYTQVAAGNSHTLVLQSDGTLYSRGSTQHGQMGDGTSLDDGTTTITANTKFTQEANMATNWTTIGVGNGDFSLARTASAQDFASTGLNTDGQLGNGTTIPNTTRFNSVILSQAAAPLPVELVSFTAWRTGLVTVALAWRTATEKNNAGFTVEKSADGRTFRAVGFVAGAGSTISLHAYSFTDGTASAAAYYRLAQADAGANHVTYSPVQFVAASPEATTGMVLVPNPAHAAGQVLGLPAATTLMLLDALGREVRTFLAPAFDVTGLPAGLYLLRATTPKQAPRTARLLVN